jgi:membrane-associated phospholipid phosphatase
MSPYRKKLLFYTLGILFCGFVFLSLVVYQFPESVVDREFSEEIQEHHFPLLDATMKWISAVGVFPYSLFLVLSVALVFLLARYRKEALYTCFTLVSGLLSSTLKILIDRPRPTESVVRIVEKANHRSFPSGHVLFYVLFFGFLALLMYHLITIPKWLRIIVGFFSLFMVFTIPFSRVYLGAHWFTDVLGAFMLGLVALLVLSYLYLRKPS